MRILQLTPRLSYPPSDGGRVVMMQIAMAMQGLGAGVRILSLNPRRQHAALDAARAALAPIPVDAIDIDTSGPSLRSLHRGTPLLVARFYSRPFARRLRDLLHEEDFDIVQIESPFLLPYLPVIRAASRAAVVLRSLNVEFRIWEQMAARAKSPLRKIIAATVARSLRQYEIRHLNRCDAIVPITEDDARDFRALGCTRPIHVLPGGVEVEENWDGVDAEAYGVDAEADGVDAETDGVDAAMDASGRARAACHSERVGRRVGEESPSHVDSRSCALAGFLGSLDYRPNQEAAIWIAEELQPLLKAEVHIAGSNAPEWLRNRLTDSEVAFDGKVPDAAAFIRSMCVMIAPLLSGGGMRIKILEAMACGRPVVSTTLGAAGIDVRHGENILLADDPGSFAGAIAELLRDHARAAAIGEAGRRLVASRYSTSVLASGLLAFYEELTKSGSVHGGR